MRNSGAAAAILRFGAGAGGSALLGYAAFREALLRPGSPPFQCITVGALMALILVAVRAGRPDFGLLIVGGFTLWHTGVNWAAGWPQVLTVCVSSAFVGGGLFVAAVIFDRLAAIGMWFGKFLVLGPLLGGVYFAISPVASWGELTTGNAFQNLVQNLALGVLIGDGVGLGVELVELLPGLHARPILTAGAEPAAVPEERR